MMLIVEIITTATSAISIPAAGAAIKAKLSEPLFLSFLDISFLKKDMVRPLVPDRDDLPGGKYNRLIYFTIILP
ncbi:MAG: hypothetical protein IIU02_09160 [Treponema sp.]|uniref:hypothetical protein n=1 Tax=Treponema sp. TaxID=166 RepID=UPI00257EDBA6|nr:hypothetical protein [Treponema sp.]MBQ5538059.1 hypothetical protein [Treponema sp.]